MQRLSVVGSVLYVAAHPDDENTRLLSAWSNGRAWRTSYVSLTRGDGGQNLIGTELGDALGILRTEELLEARRIDGGEQFFTRAVDFGFSKSPDETFAKWGREAVLADLVRVVRTTRPDVIVTRFDRDGSGGHGHHTASSLLAREAFDLAADPNAFPEQIAEGLEPWRARRLFFNGSTWWNSKLADVAAADPEHWFTVDVGGFDPLLGTSYTELAGRSRSQHKSQGFGAAETRGETLEYLRLDAGDAPKGRDAFDGIDTSWARVSGAEHVPAMIASLRDHFDVRRPEASLGELAALARALDALAATPGTERAWVRRQAGEVRELCLQTLGLVVEVTAARPTVAAGTTIDVTASVLQRRPGVRVEWSSLTGPISGSAAGFENASTAAVDRPATIEVGSALEWNRARTVDAKAIAVPSTISQPHWLAEPHAALYVPRAGTSGVAPTWPSPLTWRFALRLGDDLVIDVERPLVHTWVDRVAGQRTRLVAVTPVASIEPSNPVAIVRGERARVDVDLEARAEGLSGALTATAPAGWTATIPRVDVSLAKVGDRRRLSFEFVRSANAAAGDVEFAFEGPAGRSNLTRRDIDHAHVSPQTWYTRSRVRLVPLDVVVDARRVGYVTGAGDDVPEALGQLGVEVEILDPASSDALDLSGFDAIVTGVRAYNTVPALARFQPRLLRYVEEGGTLVVQYNTSGTDLVLDARKIGPHPFTLTRNRVTVEEAPATLLVPEHPLVSTPNRLAASDFEGWVQERGLYFAGEVDAHYVSLIGWNDPGEASQTGGLIACDHGRGRFVYTGISLFRQLPAGVPGAYRLLANLLSRREPRARASDR